MSEKYYATGKIALKNVFTETDQFHNWWVKVDVKDMKTGKAINGSMSSWDYPIPLFKPGTDEELDPMIYEGTVVEGCVEYSVRESGGKTYYTAHAIQVEAVVEDRIPAGFGNERSGANPFKSMQRVDSEGRAIVAEDGKLKVFDDDAEKLVDLHQDYTQLDEFEKQARRLLEKAAKADALFERRDAERKKAQQANESEQEPEADLIEHDAGDEPGESDEPSKLEPSNPQDSDEERDAVQLVDIAED